MLHISRNKNPGTFLHAVGLAVHIVVALAPQDDGQLGMGVRVRTHSVAILTLCESQGAALGMCSCKHHPANAFPNRLPGSLIKIPVHCFACLFHNKIPPLSNNKQTVSYFSFTKI